MAVPVVAERGLPLGQLGSGRGAQLATSVQGAGDVLAVPQRAGGLVAGVVRGEDAGPLGSQ